MSRAKVTIEVQPEHWDLHEDTIEIVTALDGSITEGLIAEVAEVAVRRAEAAARADGGGDQPPTRPPRTAGVAFREKNRGGV